MSDSHNHHHHDGRGHSHDHNGNHHHGDNHADMHAEEQAAQDEFEHYKSILYSFAGYNMYSQELLPEMPEKILRLRQAAKVNQSFFKQMIQFEVKNQDRPIPPYNPAVHKISEMNIEKAQSTLRQFVREWGELGQAERDQCYKPIIDELVKRLPVDASNRYTYTVLCPGSGLGRLPFEICKRGYCCQGNEFTYFMLVPSNFILNYPSQPCQFALYPFIHQNSNVVKDDDQFQEVWVPDVHPGSLDKDAVFSYAAGDFLEIYSDNTNSWDCVATCFFIDTANNIIDYIETIYKILKPGGIWINLGPLLYHYADMPGEISIELNLEQVLGIIRKTGFKLEGVEMRQSAYTKSPNSMLVYQYNCAFFVAIKPPAL